MSDRVAIIGGGIVGRDHFPVDSVTGDLAGSFGTNTLGPPDHYNYPFDVSVQVMCKWFYRIKKWHITLSVDYMIYDFAHSTYSAANGTIECDVTQNVIFDVDNPDTSLDVPTRESDILRPSNGLGFGFQDLGGANFPDEGPASATIENYESTGFSNHSGATLFTCQFFFHYSLPLWVAADSKFTCEILCFGSMGDASWDTFPSADVPRELTNAIGITDAPLNPSIFTSPSAGGRSIYLTSFSALLTPKEFWAYTARDASPIYDTSTGAALQDPLGDGVEYETITQNNGGTPQTANVLTDGDPWVAV